MFKGSGYCLNTDCVASFKPAFYMGTEEAYRCGTCYKWGYLEKNRDVYEGSGLVKTIMVHHKYDVVSRSYLACASVTNDTLDGKKTLHLYRPGMFIAVSALKLAEFEYAKIATGHNGLIIDLSMDKESFKKALDKLSVSLQSEYLKADLGPNFVPLEQ